MNKSTAEIIQRRPKRGLEDIALNIYTPANILGEMDFHDKDVHRLDCPFGSWVLEFSGLSAHFFQTLPPDDFLDHNLNPPIAP